MPAHRTSAALKLLSPTSSAPVRDATATDADLGGLGLGFEDVPDLLDDVGAAEWRRLGAVTANHPTRYREADRVAVTAYCSWWSAYYRAVRDLADEGTTVAGRSSADRGREVRNPAIQREREASTQLRHWARELGLSPDARVRLGIADVGRRAEPDSNPFA